MLLKERGESSRVVFSVHKLTTRMCTQLSGPRFSPGMVFCLGPILWPLNVTGLRLPSSSDVIQSLSYAEGKACCRVILGKQAVAMTIAEG